VEQVSNVDTVILAAGRNVRLNGVLPAFYKPLIVIDGQTLIRTAVELATKYSYSPPVVVVAPENALPIAQVLDGTSYHMIVQPEPTGPGDALLLGLLLTRCDTVTILMADNVIPAQDMHEIVLANTPAVCIKYVQPSDAERFTRLRRSLTWVEKVPITDDDVWEDGTTRCWVGPIKISAKRAREVLEGMLYNETHELQIGEHFNELFEHQAELVIGNTHDVGTIESLSKRG